MKLAQRLLIASTVFVGIAAIIVKAQNLPPNFGTPQGTNALAASAGFIDILGIKLGMPAEQALATLKANYPSSKISLARTADYESAWYNVERENPSHKWVFKIDVDPNGPGDKISVGLSLPPSTQVVHAVGRESFLKEPVAVENIVAGLRKKYGQETYGVDYRMGGTLTIFDGSTKYLLWIYDPRGNRVKPDAVTENAQRCLVSVTGDMGAPQLSITNGRPYEPSTLKSSPCWSLVSLTATIQMVSPTQGITGQARSFTVTAVDWPLVTSGANALYAFLDQGARDLASKQAADAKKRGGDVKY
jgi:hypothetical protein